MTPPSSHPDRPARVAALERLLRERIVVLDGAMGTMLQRTRLSEADVRGARFADWPHELRGNLDLLSLTRPELVREVHAAYLAAGADVVEMTFNVLILALLVRVVGSWFGVGRATRWMRPAYLLTEWLVEPIRKRMPPTGMFDWSPLVAWVILVLARAVLRGALF